MKSMVLIAIQLVALSIIGVCGDNFVSFKEASYAAYRQRVNLTLDWSASYTVQWHNSIGTSNEKYYETSMWLAGAALTRAKDPSVKRAAIELAAQTMLWTLTPDNMLSGGNDGWHAWACASTYASFQDIFDADTKLYNLSLPLPTVFPANQSTSLNVSAMFRLAFKYGTFAALDSTANHQATNGAARFLIEYVMPGECLFWFGLNHGSGNFGERYMSNMADNMQNGWVGEYGSPNYGPYNFMPLVDIGMLDPKRVMSLSKNASPGVDLSTLVSRAKAAYEVAIVLVGLFWFKGHWAMSCGRGYPIASGWGVTDSTMAPWIYFGGEYPSQLILGEHPWVLFRTGVKTTGLNAAIAGHFGHTLSQGTIMTGASSLPRYVRTSLAPNWQSSYMTANYSHYSEAGRLLQQASWRSRIAFTFNTSDIHMQCISFAVNPSYYYKHMVNSQTLVATHSYGSQTYGTSTQENFLQDRDAVLHVTYIPKGCVDDCIGGEIIYVPLPARIINRVTYLVSPNQYQQYMNPILRDNNKRLFYGYSSVFIAALSYSAITTGTVWNTTDWYYNEMAIIFNIYGSNDGSIIDVSQGNITIGLAMETASPYDFAGSTLAERFDAFVAKYSQIPLPRLMGYNANGGPIFTYVNARGINMTLSWKYNSEGQAAYLGKPGEPVNNASRLNYGTQWPFLYEEITLPNGTVAVWLNAKPYNISPSTSIDYFIPEKQYLAPYPLKLTIYNLTQKDANAGVVNGSNGGSNNGGNSGGASSDPSALNSSTNPANQLVGIASGVSAAVFAVSVCVGVYIFRTRKLRRQNHIHHSTETLNNVPLQQSQ